MTEELNEFARPNGEERSSKYRLTPSWWSVTWENRHSRLELGAANWQPRLSVTDPRVWATEQRLLGW